MGVCISYDLCNVCPTWLDASEMGTAERTRGSFTESEKTKTVPKLILSTTTTTPKVYNIPSVSLGVPYLFSFIQTLIIHLLSSHTPLYNCHVCVSHTNAFLMPALFHVLLNLLYEDVCHDVVWLLLCLCRSFSMVWVYYYVCLVSISMTSTNNVLIFCVFCFTLWFLCSLPCVLLTISLCLVAVVHSFIHLFRLLLVDSFW